VDVESVEETVASGVTFVGRTSDGRILATAMKMLCEPFRSTVCARRMGARYLAGGGVKPAWTPFCGTGLTGLPGRAQGESPLILPRVLLPLVVALPDANNDRTDARAEAEETPCLSHQNDYNVHEDGCLGSMHGEA